MFCVYLSIYVSIYLYVYMHIYICTHIYIYGIVFLGGTEGTAFFSSQSLTRKGGVPIDMDTYKAKIARPCPAGLLVLVLGDSCSLLARHSAFRCSSIASVLKNRLGSMIGPIAAHPNLELETWIMLQTAGQPLGLLWLREVRSRHKICSGADCRCHSLQTKQCTHSLQRCQRIAGPGTWSRCLMCS